MSDRHDVDGRAFDDLLARLAAEHRTLRLENEALRAALAAGGGVDAKRDKGPMDVADVELHCMTQASQEPGRNVFSVARARLATGDCVSTFHFPNAQSPVNGDPSSPAESDKRRQKAVLSLYHGTMDLDKGDSRLRWFVQTPLDGIASCLVLLDCVMVFVNLELEGYDIDRIQGFTDIADTPRYVPSVVFETIERIITGFFVIEMALRLAVLRKDFFVRGRSVKWYRVLDLCIVMASAMELYIASPVLQRAGAPISALRLVSLLPIIRNLRLARISKLRLLIHTFIIGLSGLGWSLLLTLFFMVVSSMIVCHAVQSCLHNADLPFDVRQKVYLMYGTLSRSIWTMFQVTFAGSWPVYAKPLVEDVSGYFIVFFSWYVCWVVFAALRIATALLVRDTMASANKESSLTLELQIAAKRKHAEKLHQLFVFGDTSGDGEISYDEFQALCQAPEAAHVLSNAGVVVSDADRLFKLLEDGSGRVTVDNFVDGLTRVAGGATALDIVALRKDAELLMSLCYDIRAMCTGQATASGVPMARQPLANGKPSISSASTAD